MILYVHPQKSMYSSISHSTSFCLHFSRSPFLADSRYCRNAPNGLWTMPRNATAAGAQKRPGKVEIGPTWLAFFVPHLPGYVINIYVSVYLYICHGGDHSKKHIFLVFFFFIPRKHGWHGDWWDWFSGNAANMEHGQRGRFWFNPRRNDWTKQPGYSNPIFLRWRSTKILVDFSSCWSCD